MKTYALTLVALALCAMTSWAGEVIPQPHEETVRLEGLAGEMSKAHDRLEAEHHGQEVQVIQKKIADALDKLIKLMEQPPKSAQEPPCSNPPSPFSEPGPPGPGTPTSGSKPTSGNMPTSAMRDEFMVTGTTRHGPKALLGKVGAKWGHLPGITQRQVLQAMASKFPAHYRRMLIAYLICIADRR